MPLAAIWISQVGEGLGEQGLIHQASLPAFLSHTLPQVCCLQRVVVSEHIGLAQDNDASLGKPDRFIHRGGIDQAETSRGWVEGGHPSFKTDPAVARKDAGFHCQYHGVIVKRMGRPCGINDKDMM